MPGPYVCYILTNASLTRTYAGSTCDITRRLRQHNGELKGGAKYTTSGRPWAVWAVVGEFQTQRDALRFEWRMKQHRNWFRGLRGAPLARRRKLLGAALEWADVNISNPLNARFAGNFPTRFPQRGFHTLGNAGPADGAAEGQGNGTKNTTQGDGAQGDGAG